MGAYAIFNYQFDKILEHSRQYKLEGIDTVVMSAEEAFPKRQEIFGAMLEKDYAKVTSNDVIHFKNAQGLKEYIHRHLMKPTDDIVIMRVANTKPRTFTDSDWKVKRIEDFQNCIVIIDNRPGIQRILIENKKTAFRDVKQVERIMEHTFNKLLCRYSLKIRLEHLQDKRIFWQYAYDTLSYPKGFHRVSIRLPYPNLERLKKVYNRLFNQARESFDSRIDLDFVAPEGGQIRLNQNDSYQSELIGWLMEEAGADVKMFSNLAKKSPIHVGKNSYRVVSISDTTISRISEESHNGDLFGSSALDEVKSKLKTGIDSD